MLVTAPHATFIDPMIIGVTRSTVVAKHSLSTVPFISSLARLVQVLFVNRGKEDSRKATRDAIDSYTTAVKVSQEKSARNSLRIFREMKSFYFLRPFSHAHFSTHCPNQGDYLTIFQLGWQVAMLYFLPRSILHTLLFPLPSRVQLENVTMTIHDS